jgi:hypothetical protein
VNPELLGMKKVASEDSVRRALIAMKEEKSELWMKQQLKASYFPLLEEPWILDIDSTVKPLYGHQEDAMVGYNPTKPGRPSHVYHSYFIGNLRLVLEVEVQAGNQMASSMRSRIYGSCWTDWRQAGGPRFCEGTVHGEPNGRWWEPKTGRFPMYSS